MKKYLNKFIVAMILIGTLISLSPISAKASVKLEDSKKWFHTNSYYVKSISIPLDYYNYNAEYVFEQDYKRYTSYYIYDNLLQPSYLHKTIDITYKIEYDKSIITIKKIQKSNQTALAIKPIKKGSTNLKITVSAKGYQPYSITTRINILDKGKVISTKTALNPYFNTAERSRKGYHFVPDVINELNLKNKSLYEKVLNTSQWCINNYDDLKEQYYKKNENSTNLHIGFRKYMNSIFIEFMKELGIPACTSSTYDTFVLMNDDKWYMVDVSNAYNSTYEVIKAEMIYFKEQLDLYKQLIAEHKEDIPNQSVEEYKELIAINEAEITNLQAQLDLIKTGKPVNLPYTLIKADDKSIRESSIKGKVDGKELAIKDMLTDPDNTQKSYLGKIPRFTAKKLTINLLNSYKKLVKLPLALNGIKSDDIEIRNRVSYRELVWKNEVKKKDVYISTDYVLQSGNVIIEATSFSTLFDTMEVEIICPTIDGQQGIHINNVKRGSKIKIPLTDATFSDFIIKSYNTRIATVSADGVITAKSKGQTFITLQSKTNSKFILEVNIGVEERYNPFTLKTKN